MIAPTEFAFRSGERESLPQRIERYRDALSRLVIAIDGPAGSGKSTTASAVASRLRLRHLDSGALYRALTLAALRAGVPADAAAALVQLVRHNPIQVTSAAGATRVWLAGEDVTEAVRAPEVTAAVSRVSAHPEVRAAMLEQQRQLAAAGGTVMEGRDIGSVVLPQADLKVFLTADVAARAERRQREEAGRGRTRPLDAIGREIAARDHADSTRAAAPLVCPPDAVRIDTTRLSIEGQADAVVALALRCVEARTTAAPGLQTGPDRSGGTGQDTGQDIGQDNGQGSGQGTRQDTEIDAQEWAQPGYRVFRHRRYRLAHDSIGAVARVWFGMRRHVHPAAHLPGSVLVACNHISGLDPPIVGAALPFEMWFVAKRELFRNAVFGRIIRAFNAYPIHRGTADYPALDHAVELLRAGCSVLMFPEGTRQVPGKLGRPRWGFGYVAHRAARPVVPVFVRGTRDRRPIGFRREPMHVWVGEPFRLEPGEETQESYLRLGELALEHIAGLMLRSAAEHALPGLELPGEWASRPVVTGP